MRGGSLTRERARKDEVPARWNSVRWNPVRRSPVRWIPVRWSPASRAPIPRVPAPQALFLRAPCSPAPASRVSVLKFLGEKAQGQALQPARRSIPDASGGDRIGGARPPPAWLGMPTGWRKPVCRPVRGPSGRWPARWKPEDPALPRAGHGARRPIPGTGFLPRFLRRPQGVCSPRGTTR